MAAPTAPGGSAHYGAIGERVRSATHSTPSAEVET